MDDHPMPLMPSLISPPKPPVINVTPITMTNYRPSTQSSPSNSLSSSSGNLCLVPTTSTVNITRVIHQGIQNQSGNVANSGGPLLIAAPPPQPQPSPFASSGSSGTMTLATTTTSSTAAPTAATTTTNKTSSSRKKKEETPSTTINYETDYLCYECGDFFTEKSAFDEHKSYHSFTRIAMRMFIEQERGDAIVNDVERSLDPEEEKEYMKLRNEQSGRKREIVVESNSALNPGLHQNHNMAINSTLLDKRPAVKQFNLKTKTRIISSTDTPSSTGAPKSKAKKYYYSGDINNPVATHETVEIKECVKRKIAQAKRKIKISS